MLQSEMRWGLLDPGESLYKCRGWKASSVIRGRCTSKDKSSKEKWNTGITTAVLSKCWQRLENVFVLFPGTHNCKCILCHHAGLLPTSQHQTCQVTQDCGMRLAVCDQGVSQETNRKPRGHHIVWHEGTPWLARYGLHEVQLAWGTCQGFGSQELLLLPCKGRDGGTTERVVHLADTLECIYTAQCIINFSSKWRENRQLYILRSEEEIMPVDFLCYFHRLSCSWFAHACKVFLDHLWCSLNQEQPTNFLVF